MLPLVFVINDWIVPWRVPLLGLDRTTKIALVATLGLIHIALRVLLSPRGWAIKCVALIALIPVVVLATDAVNRFVWIDYFSAERESAKRVSGAATIGTIGLLILVRGMKDEWKMGNAKGTFLKGKKGSDTDPGAGNL